MLLILPFLLLAPQAPPARPPARVEASPRPDAPATTDADKERAAREKEDAPVVTHHETRVGGRTLRYTVTTGMMPLRDEAGDTEATVFYMAYVADRPEGAGNGR
jgi:carboxypeptidase C (cathepsin A)